MTTTALSEVLHRMRTHKVNHGKNTSPTLIAFADEIESALASAEPVAWKVVCKKPGQGTTTWNCWSTDGVNEAKRRAHLDGYADEQITVRPLIFAHAKPAAKVEAPESIEYPGDYMPPNSCELERLADTVTSTYADGGKDETAMWVGGRLRLLARKIAMLEAELQKLPAPTPASVPDGLCAVQRYMVKLETNAHGHNYVKAVEDPDGDFVFHEDAAAHEAHGLTSKQAWWAGARAGLGVPADMPRKRVADLLGQRVVIDVYQQDWMPGFAAFLDDGSLAENGRPKFAINLGAFIASVSTGDIEKSEIPYFVAETLMHEVIHVIEKWAGVEFSEEWVDALIEKYTLASRSPDNQEGTTP